ncbi:M6 family metalloprotease domain-containing protein [Candidatus Bipolaricaulota bacterium]
MGICSVLILLACAVSGAAGPAAPIVFTLEQPNGTTFQAHTVGDEWGHWTETVDGYTVLLAETSGYWVYAVAGPNGALVAGSPPVGEGAPPAVDRHLRPISSEQGSPLGTPDVRISGVSFAPPVAGTHKVLVLVVDFSDQAVATSPAYWSTAFFGGTTGSIDDYFNEVSYGQLPIAPALETYGTANDGVVFVTLAYPHPDTRGSITDANRLIVRNAIIAADPYVDFESFDTNPKDGHLSTDELHLVTVVAGYETSYGGAASCTPSVWAHRSALGYFSRVVAPTVDDVIVGHYSGGGGTMGGYTQVGEWHCVTGNPPGHAGTIGQIVHELGHDLGSGIPDLYDTDGSSEGIGNWCLQAAGGWNSTTLLGDTPAHWSAWAKWYLGILTPAQITTNTNDTSFPRVEDATGANHGVYQVLNNPSGVDWNWGSTGSGEYFLLENRQQFGYDAGIPGSGLCIWHVYEAAPSDNTANANEGSTAPGNPRLVVMEQMDGNFDLEGYGNPNGGTNRGDTSDPWVSPYAFTDASTPNSRLYSGVSTGVSVIDISASAATMTADIQFGPPPTAAVFRVDAAGNVLADQAFYGASFQTGAADVAEWVLVSEPVKAGDVLELDPENPQHYRKTTGSCSSLVAGVVSTDPGVVLGSSPLGFGPWTDDSRLVTEDSALLALIGIVPVKACDEGGPIEPGDLLVPASIPGYIRRWDPEHADFCDNFVGKALEPLEIGTNQILILLMR